MQRLSLAMAFALSACSVDSATEPPEGSIQVSEQVWMVPVGEDESGCPQYTAWSPEGAVLTVIQYRRPDGGFSALREEADCPALN